MLGIIVPEQNYKQQQKLTLEKIHEYWDVLMKYMINRQHSNSFL